MKETVTKVFEIQWEVCEAGYYAAKPESFEDIDEALAKSKDLLLNSQSHFPMIQIRRNEIQINQAYDA